MPGCTDVSPARSRSLGRACSATQGRRTRLPQPGIFWRSCARSEVGTRQQLFSTRLRSTKSRATTSGIHRATL
eukprot:3364432-Pyramimonas_sp.AAC.1